MKKWLLALVILLLAIGLVGCGAQTEEPAAEEPAAEEPAADQSLQKILDKGELVIGLDDNFPPAGFRDEAGELVGFDVDLAAAACEKMGVKANFKPVEWDGVLLNLKNGDIDVIWNALTVTPEREKEIAFSRVYIDTRTIIIVAKDSPIKGKADLEGKVVGVQLGSSADDSVKNDAIAAKIKEVRKFGSYAEAFMDLDAGRIDAVVTDDINGRYSMTQEKIADKFIVLTEGEDFGGEQFAVGLRQEDLALQAAINKALDDMAADGTTAAINQKWFSGEIIK